MDLALSLSITLALVFLLVILPELELTLLAADMEPPVVAVVHGTTLAGEATVAGFATLLAQPSPGSPVFPILRSLLHNTQSSSSKTAAQRKLNMSSAKIRSKQKTLKRATDFSSAGFYLVLRLRRDHFFVASMASHDRLLAT